MQHDGARAGLVVDELFGAGQAVIKPLGNYFADVPGIAGSSILGNGRVALILDTATIFRNAGVLAGWSAGVPPAQRRDAAETAAETAALHNQQENA